MNTFLVLFSNVPPKMQGNWIFSFSLHELEWELIVALATIFSEKFDSPWRGNAVVRCTRRPADCGEVSVSSSWSWQQLHPPATHTHSTARHGHCIHHYYYDVYTVHVHTKKRSCKPWTHVHVCMFTYMTVVMHVNIHTYNYTCVQVCTFFFLALHTIFHVCTHRHTQ